MSDVKPFAPVSASPWTQSNALDPQAPLLDPSEETPKKVDYQAFSEWGSQNASGDDLEDLKGYTSYVRDSYIEADGYSVSVENELRSGLYQAAVSKRAIAEDEGSEAINEKLFGSPKYSPEAGIRMIAESSSSSISAMAANNLDQLPEGTDPNQVWDDIVTYRAKEKAYAKSMAVDPEATSQNDEIKTDLEYWKQRAEGYASSGIFDRASKDALLDGRVTAARVYKEDGSSYVQLGKAAQGKTVKQIIASSKDFGVTSADALDIAYQLEQPDGFKYQRFDLLRKEELSDIVGGVVSSNDTAAKQYDKITRLYKEYDKALVEDDPANTERLDRLINEETQMLYVTAGGVNSSLENMDMDLGEFRTVVAERATQDLINTGQFKLQDDPNKIGHNLKRYGYGPARIHASLVSNVDKFEQTISANQDLTDADKKMLRDEREAMSARNFDPSNELLSEGASSEQWLKTLTDGRAEGKKDHHILEEFLKDPDNYDEFEARATGVGAAWGQGFVSMVTAPLAMMDVKWARDHLINVQAENSKRRERARMFGVEFGVGQDVMETVGPVLADMAVTAALTVTTGAGGVAYMAAKQGAKLTTTGLIKGIVKGGLTTRTSMRRLGNEGSEEALDRLVKANYLTKPPEATRVGAIEAMDQFGKWADSKFTQAAAINMPAFNRSAGSTYATTYSTLKDNNPEMSHDEIHDAAFGAGLLGGFATVATMSAFKAIGRGGIEDAFIKGMTKKESLQVVERMVGRGAGVKLGSENSKKIWAGAVARVQKDMIKGANKFKGQKNWVRESLDGFGSEALEEAIDEVANSYITDHYTDTNTGLARWEAAFKAGLTGGFIGAGMPVAQRLGNRTSARARADQDMRKQESDFRDGLVSNLNENNSPAMADLVDRVLFGQARGAKAVKARASLTQELDPNFVPPSDEPSTQEAPAAPVLQETEASKQAAARAEAAAAPAVAPMTEPQVQELKSNIAEKQTEVEEVKQAIEVAPNEEAKAALEERLSAVVEEQGNLEGTLESQTATVAAQPAQPQAEQVIPVAQNKKWEHEPFVDGTPSNTVLLPDSDVAALNDIQETAFAAMTDEFSDAQLEALDSAVRAGEQGTVREFRVAEAIMNGDLTMQDVEVPPKKEGGKPTIKRELIGDLPAAQQPERTVEGNLRNMALILETGARPYVQFSQAQADTEVMRGTKADYALDTKNFVVGVRSPDTGEWVGKKPIDQESVDFLDRAESTVTPKATKENWDAVKEENARVDQRPAEPTISITPLTKDISQEERVAVQGELGLQFPEDGQLTNSDTETLNPITESQTKQAQDEGYDLQEIADRQADDIKKAERVVVEPEVVEAKQPSLAKASAVLGKKLAQPKTTTKAKAKAKAQQPDVVEDVVSPAVDEEFVQTSSNVVDSDVDREALIELVASGFPQRISSTSQAGFDYSTSKAAKYYDTISDTAAVQIYKTWPVTKDYRNKTSVPQGSTVFKGRKIKHYDPYNTTKGTQKIVRGWVDSNGSGIFNNDPNLTAEFLYSDVPVKIPKDFPRDQLNPAIQADPDTGLVINVMSPSNLILGTKQGVEAGRADRVVETQPNYDRYVNYTNFVSLLNKELGQTVISTNTMPTIYGNTEKVDSNRAEPTVAEFTSSVRKFIYDGLSMTGSTESRRNIETAFQFRGEMDNDYLEEAANAAVTDAAFTANAYAMRQRLLAGPSKRLLETKLDTDGKPTGEYKLIIDSQVNRGRLLNELISFTKVADAAPNLKEGQILKALDGLSQRGITTPDAGANFVLDNIINNRLLLDYDGRMPPMIAIINGTADRYRKQQASRMKGEEGRVADTLFYEDQKIQAPDELAMGYEEGTIERPPIVTATKEDGGSPVEVTSFKREVEQKPVGQPRPIAATPEREALYDTLDTAAFNIGTVLSEPANQDLRVAFNEMAEAVVGSSDLARQRIAELDADDLVNIVADFVMSGKRSPRVNKFLKTLESPDVSPAIQSLRTSFKLMNISSRSVSGDPSMNKEYVESVRDALQASMGESYTTRDAQDYIRAIDNSVRNLWSRSRLTKAQQKIARAVNAAEVERLGLVSGDPESVINALTVISETGTESHQLVADLLLENPELIRNVKFTIGESDLAAAGVQSIMADGSLEVYINLNGHNGRGLSNVLLEEYTHATLVKLINKPVDEMTPAQRAAVTRLNNLMADIKSSALANGYKPNSPIMDSLANLDEFVAGILLSPDLQKEIKALGADANGKNFFRRIADAIMRFFRKGVTAQESSQYVDAITDVIDLAQSTVTVSDPRFRTRAKRLAQQVTAEMTNTANASRVAGVDYITAVDRGLDSEVAATNENVEDMVNQLDDTDLDVEGTVYTAEQAEAKRKAESLLSVARELVPPEVPLEINRTMSSPAEFDQEKGIVFINPKKIMELTQDLSLTTSKMVVAKQISHELSHVASVNTLSEVEIIEMADTISINMYEDTIDAYYEGSPNRAARARALLTAENLDARGLADQNALRIKMTEEHLRMKMELLTTGYTTEQDWAFHRTNPSTLNTLFRYVSGYFRRMSEMKKLNKNADNQLMDAALNRLVHELRSIKAGYRMQESMSYFDPTNPDAGYGILADKIEEGLADPDEFVESLRDSKLRSATEPSAGFDQDKMDFSGFIDQLELPVYASGGYRPPAGKIDELMRGSLDPRVQRFVERRDFFIQASEQNAKAFKEKFDRQIKKAFDGRELDDADITLLNNAVGKSAIMSEESRTQVENEYQEELELIALADYETRKAEEVDKAIALGNRHAKVIALQKAKAVEIRRDQEAALAELDAISPELAETIRDIRAELITPIQEKMKDLYGLSDTLRAHFDVQQGIYITTTYKMFTETGFAKRVREDGAYHDIREAAIAHYNNEHTKARVVEMKAEANRLGVVYNAEDAQRIIQMELEQENPASKKTLGQTMMDDFITKYETAAKDELMNPADADVMADNLKEKRDIPKALQDLLGVADNNGGVDNLIRTYVTVSKMAATQAMFRNMKSIGLSEGFMMTAADWKKRTEDPETHEEYKHWQPVVVGASSEYNPLRDMMAPPEATKGFRELLKPKVSNDDNLVAKTVAGTSTVIRQLSGLSMATKTLGSVGFYLRNMLSNMLFFGPSQGFVNVFAMGKKAGYIWQELKDPNRMDAYLSELTSLGVIKNEIRSTLMEDMLKGTRTFDDILKESNVALQLLGKGADATLDKPYKVATRMAGAVDAFYKIAYYENELGVLRKARAAAIKDGSSYANYSDTDLKQMAADKILMTAQSSSQAPPIVKNIASHGIGALVAPFIRFKAEVPRVALNTFKLAYQETQSDNPVIRRRGIQRGAGMLSVGVVFSGFGGALAASWMDTDDEEMEDFQRDTAPSYLRGHTFLSFAPGFLPKLLGGSKKNYQSIDLTYINPYALLADPVIRAYEKISRGDIVGGANALISGLVFDQYLDTQIAAQAVISMTENRDPTTGKPIVEDISDTTGEAFYKKATFLLQEAYSPDVLKRGIKAAQTAASEEGYVDPDHTVLRILGGAFLPFKVHTIDPEKQLRNYLFRSKEEFSNIRSRKNVLRSMKPQSTDDIIDIMNEEQENRTAISNHNIRMMKGAIKYGLAERQAYQTLRDAGIPERRASNLMFGQQDRINITPDWAEGMVKYKETEEEKAVMLNRLNTIWKWVAAQPQNQKLVEGPVAESRKP